MSHVCLMKIPPESYSRLSRGKCYIQLVTPSVVVSAVSTVTMT